MSQSLSNVLLHIIFSTKMREPFFDPRIREELFPYTATVFKGLGCPALEIGGVEDHIHILCNFSRTITIADLIEEIKKPTSKWVKTKGTKYQRFAWQNGYGNL